MDTPAGYTYVVDQDECIIDHYRTGMGCLNLFLGVWLAGWTFGCAFLVRAYVNGGKMESGDPIQLWFVMAFVGPWFFVAFLLLYSIFARKRFRLASDTFHIETQLWFLNWSISIPRESISEIKQIKDGGEGDDSFPSWGLLIRSSALVDGPMHRLVWLSHFGRTYRMRTILARLPYDHSAWLATVLSDWSGVPASLCPKPEADAGPRSASDSRNQTN